MKRPTAKINAQWAGEAGSGGGAHGGTRGNRAFDAKVVMAAIIPMQFENIFLVEHKLINPGEKMSRHHLKRKMNVDNDAGQRKEGGTYVRI